MPEPSIAVENVNVSYGSNNTQVQALKGVSLTFCPGTLTLVMGPSGSGKTTLLSVLGCLLSPDSGRVLLNGTDVTQKDELERTALRRRLIGFVFQAFRLFRSLTALENVLVAADIAGGRQPSREKAARDLLAGLGLTDKLHLKPNELSGGEKQRVAIARAILLDPPVLLADEPTASLDGRAGHEISGILANIAAQRNGTVVVVSHDTRWSQFAHRTIILEDGRVAKNGEPA